MSAPDPIRVDVQTETSGDHLVGEVSCDGRPPVAFSGWLGLMGAIERARQTAPDQTTTNETSETGS